MWASIGVSKHPMGHVCAFHKGTRTESTQLQMMVPLYRQTGAEVDTDPNPSAFNGLSHHLHKGMVKSL